MDEIDSHSLQAMPWFASHAVSSFQVAAEAPSFARSSWRAGWVFLPIKAFGKSIRTFFLDSDCREVYSAVPTRRLPGAQFVGHRAQSAV